MFGKNNLDNQYVSSWEPELDLDVFFTDMYNYHYHKGFPAILLENITNNLILSFTIQVASFLFVFVNWSELSSCTSSETCKPYISHYLDSNPFDHPTRLQQFGISYFFIFSLYLLRQAFMSFDKIRRAFKMQTFYIHRLGISNPQLLTLEWSEVLVRVIQLHHSGSVRVVMSEKLDEHIIVSRILRRENFLIAMYNNGVFDLRLPIVSMDELQALFRQVSNMHVSSVDKSVRRIIGGYRGNVSINEQEDINDLQDPLLSTSQQQNQQQESVYASFMNVAQAKSQQLYLTRALEWSVRFCVTDRMFDDRFQVRPSFLSNPGALRFNFILLGVVQFFLLPFLVVHTVIQFLLQNTQLIRSDYDSFGPRQWSPLAWWIFRCFNELPHDVERRLSASYSFAIDYCNLRPRVLTIILCRCVSIMIGSLIFCLLLFALVNNAILLHVKIGPHELVWYMTVLSALYAASHLTTASAVLAPSSYVSNSVRPIMSCTKIHEQANRLLESVANFTYVYPDHWKNRALASDVFDEFSNLFQNKFYLFCLEIMSVILTPAILCFSLPKCSEKIVDFVIRHAREDAQIGNVCDYSQFDFGRLSDKSYCPSSQRRHVPAASDLMRSQSSPGNTPGNTPSADNKADQKSEFHTHLPKRERSAYGKMEKSFIAFVVNYPNWKCNATGQDVLDQLHLFRNKMVDSLFNQQDEKSPCDVQKSVPDAITPLSLDTSPSVDKSSPPPLHHNPSNLSLPALRHLPPFLLSAMRNAKIDPNEDIYWLEKFHDVNTSQYQVEPNSDVSIVGGGFMGSELQSRSVMLGSPNRNFGYIAKSISHVSFETRNEKAAKAELELSEMKSNEA